MKSDANPKLSILLQGEFACTNFMKLYGNVLYLRKCRVLLLIKSLSDTERSITIVAYATFLMTPLSLIPALFVWQWPTSNELMWLAFIGLTAGCAQFFIAQALHETDLNVVMPFDFTKLIFL